MAVSTELDRRVRERARGHCVYCRLPQSAYPLTFEVDHVIAEQHRGKTRFNNLCLACTRCNRNKGPNIASIDAETHDLVSLFNPRRDAWAEHFRWRGPRLIGLTPVGRVTIHVLAMNHPNAVRIRRELIAAGGFPPEL
jgi:hypothetical protein